ncbi:mitochondrial protein Pet127-domain-containing protein [Flagelloscypha sp. PMI_526]|nr:mitochondrial protein Pet127-domain-containing protein [Flagelloscypha sp. PMI_526]
MRSVKESLQQARDFQNAKDRLKLPLRENRFNSPRPQPSLGELKTRLKAKRSVKAAVEDEKPWYLSKVEALCEHKEGPILRDLVPPTKQHPVPTLAHGLNRVLFNPGVHWLRDPRSQVYNFTPWLEHIPKVTDFAFERMQTFIPSSEDPDLLALAVQNKKRFVGSTSSLTGMLSHIYFLISEDKDVDTSSLSTVWKNQKSDFTSGQRMPSAVRMNFKNGVYSIDSSDSYDNIKDKNILLWLGHVLERFFTMPQKEFEAYLRSKTPEWTPPPQPKEPVRDAYRFAMSSTFVMRSQLDCVDPSLPGTGVFDIKTRGTSPIRMDILNFMENSASPLKQLVGLKDSFEKEYYDLIRSAFLKYSFQARIGNMDGVLCAYHNTGKVFGFQYLPLIEMEARLYGAPVGERVFNKCVELLEAIMKEVERCFPGESVQVAFETQQHKRRLDVVVSPVDGPRKDEVKMLEVTATNFIDEQATRGSTAVTSSLPWTIHYVIAEPKLTPVKVETVLAGITSRLSRTYALPTGVTLSTVSQFWHSLNFTSSTVTQTTGEVDPKWFKEPDANQSHTRMQSKEEREAAILKAAEEKGKPKKVLNLNGDGHVAEDWTVYDDWGYATEPPKYDFKGKAEEDEDEKAVHHIVARLKAMVGERVHVFFSSCFSWHVELNIFFSPAATDFTRRWGKSCQRLSTLGRFSV